MNGEEGNHSHHHRSEFHNTHKGEMPCCPSFSPIHAAHQAPKPQWLKPRRGISRSDRRWFRRRVSPARSDIQQLDPSPASMSSRSSSLFQWKIKFHLARKPFKGFSNGGATANSGLRPWTGVVVVLIKGDPGRVNWVLRGREEIGWSFWKMGWILSLASGSLCGKL